MTALWAIFRNTWQQSKHQWVMLLVIFMLLVVIGASFFLVEVKEGPDGEPFLSASGAEFQQTGWEERWNGLYANAVKQEKNYYEGLEKTRQEVDDALAELNEANWLEKEAVKRGESEEVQNQMSDRRRLAEMELDKKNSKWKSQMKYLNTEVGKVVKERSAGITPLEKGMEAFMGSLAYWLFRIALFGFIAISAGYIPNMIESGSIDIVLSKPIRRWQLYLGKYLGGLGLFSAIVSVTWVVTFTLMGFKTGIWQWSFFKALPFTLFAMALLYSIIAWVGLWTRSTSMAMVLGYVYYAVVDSAVTLLGSPNAVPGLTDQPGFRRFASYIEWGFPSFKWLMEASEAAVYSVPFIPWHTVIVGAVWLVVCLGTSYNRFRINDY
ncbi:MAG: ABC transporter permease subunit [Planctomycetes bacterium]|nr:ABC transporter permease subunit [Planctomycetota bacterium]